MKILHVVENVGRGSVERWLLRTYRHACRIGRPFDWTFYCYEPHRGEFEDDAEREGLAVVHSPVPLSDKIGFLAALRKQVVRGGYDIMHSHHDFLSAFYYAGTLGCDIRRITHVHNTDEIIPTSNRILRRLLLPPMRSICIGMSEAVLSTSNHCLEYFFVGHRTDPKRHFAHYCSIDLEKIWSAPQDRAAVRAELNVEPEAKLLLFVGSMIDLKNPMRLVEMMPYVLKDEPSARAVFLGDGPERQHLLARAAQLGIAGRIRVLGWREDVARLMRTSDLFVNPRREYPPEGLGLVNVEAQAAGLPALVSDGISEEALLAGCAHCRIALALGPAVWAQEAVAMLRRPPVPLGQVQEILTASPFNADFGVAALHEIYAIRSGARSLKPARAERPC